MSHKICVYLGMKRFISDTKYKVENGCDREMTLRKERDKGKI